MTKVLEQIVDSKSVHWTLRTAEAIGRAGPSGQLADFLGEEVVNSLWGTRPDAVQAVQAHLIVKPTATFQY